VGGTIVIMEKLGMAFQYGFVDPVDKGKGTWNPSAIQQEQ
jgi:hypothetical protein